NVSKIVSIYCSPSNNVSSLCNKLNDYLESNISSDMLLIGDINLDIHKNCVQGAHNRIYLDMLSRFCFLQFTDGYTRISSNSLGGISKSHIDYCFIGSRNLTRWKFALLKWSITDHYALFVN